jgi:hypothetical protein
MQADELADQPTRRSSISTGGAEGGWPATWITTADPTPNAAGSSPCTLHSAVDQGVCVPSASAPMGMLFLPAAVAECDTSDSIDAVVNCCGLWAEEAEQQQGATRGVLQEAAKRAWHPQVGVVGFHFHCATAWSTLCAGYHGRTSLMAVRDLNERGGLCGNETLPTLPVPILRPEFRPLQLGRLLPYLLTHLSLCCASRRHVKPSAVPCPPCTRSAPSA